MKRMILTLAALGSLLGGCASAHLDTPNGFAAYEDNETYDFYASDGEGVVIAVRTEKNRPQGDLSYWTSSLDAQLRGAGYQTHDVADVKSADGHAGKQLQYVVDDNGRDLVFWVSIFVTDRQVVLVEAGGDVAFFEPKVAQIQSAIASLHVG